MKICEHFRSIQGEGLMIGAPTYFIRTSGCNLRCSWCDTAYALSGGMDATLDDIIEFIGDSANVCLTGGEPLLQEEMPELMKRLVDAGKHIVLETNGSVDLTTVPKSGRIIISMDIKCPSSGMSDRMLVSNLAHLSNKDQLKFVINDYHDFNYAVKFLNDNHVETNVIFSPVGGMNLRKLAEAVVSKKLNVRVLPQLHKIIWGDARSV
ncbi:MAG: radical SAM protein [Candidatus Methanoplasma sp.]|jgi:7-carboxy-7-deazaguanine synthase|nr:radical SAM protein [Candidatus Methanoplasma sp.]